MSISIKPLSSASNVVFSDVNLNVNSGSPQEKVFNLDSIQNSIVTILNTRKGSRVFNRRFGSLLEDILFEPMDQSTTNQIKSALLDAIREWEPRVKIQLATVLPDYENQQYYVELVYIVPQLSNSSITLNFNLSQNL